MANPKFKHVNKEQEATIRDAAESAAEFMAIYKESFAKQAFTPAEKELLLQEAFRNLNQIQNQNDMLENGPMQKIMAMMEHMEKGAKH